MKRKIIAPLLLIFVFLSAISVQADTDNMEIKRLSAISYRGNCEGKYAENSLQAIRSAGDAGADAVYVNIKFTSDGIAVLLADDDLTRVTDCEETTPVSEMTLEQVKTYHTKIGYGGVHADTTPHTIYTLAEIYKSIENSVPLMLDFEWEHFDEVYNTVKDSLGLHTAIFVCRCSVKEYNEKISSLDTVPNTVLYRKTNIVFTSLSVLKATNESYKGSAWLATSNTYGVNWYKSVAKNADKELYVCTAEPDLCGQRYDTESYWDDLVSRGYTAIISDNIEKLVEFRDESYEAATVLAEKIASEDEINRDYDSLTAYSAIEYVKAYNDAYQDSVDALTHICGKREANECIYKIDAAVKNIELNFTELSDGTAGKTVNISRILICLAATALVIAAEVYCWKKRKR